jgi:uncharacterized protein (DUF1499 family)
MQSSLFFRVFCFCGILFGALQALLAAVQGASAGETVFIGLSAGLFFGLFLAAFVTAAHHWRLKKTGMNPATTDTRVDVQERITLPLPSDQALALCRSAVTQVPRASDVQVDAAAAMVAARVGMSWASFGEHIECRVTPAEGAAVVSIRSRPVLATTLVDYGKNRENVERIRAYMARRASPAPAPQA